MNLSPMRYKTYVWPHNPRTYTIEYQRVMSVRKIPFGRYALQDLGPTRRIMRGEGEFTGPEAYEEFKKLASVFYANGPGMLVHPVWQCASAYFVDLSLRQEPRKDYVAYSFTFWEDFTGHKTGLTAVTQTGSTGGQNQQTAASATRYHTVVKGESLWSIAVDYGIPLHDLIALNPQIKNPNLIHIGEKVRVQ